MLGVAAASDLATVASGHAHSRHFLIHTEHYILDVFLTAAQYISQRKATHFSDASGHAHSQYSPYLNHFLMFLIVGIHNQVKPERDCQSCERQTLSQVHNFLL